MKKKHGMILLSLFIIMTSVTLLINKSSYAVESINYCVDTFNGFRGSNEELELIKGLPLPKMTEALMLEENHETIKTNLGQVLSGRFEYLYWDDKVISGQVEKETESPEMGYFLTKLKFSNNEIENNYYQQVLLFWAMDRLDGFEDEYNYTCFWDENDERICTPTDEEEGRWNYIPAKIKTEIKSQPIGTKMLNYLEEWENYINWSLQESKTIEMDQINQDNITYTITDEYIETNLIIPTNKNKPYEKLFDSYQVELSQPFLVVNSNGEEQTSFKSGEGFKIRILIAKIKNNKLDYSINIKGIYTIPSASIYASKLNPQSLGVAEPKEIFLDYLYNGIMLRNCILEHQVTSTMTITDSEQIGTLNIKVIDAETKENLSNAEIVIYDSLGNVVYRKETTDKEISVTLPVGDYTVKQTVTPPNYQARVVEQRVTVTENNTTETVIENVQLVDVPDLGRSTTGIIMVIGGLVLIIGCIIIGTNLRKKDIKIKN